LDLKLYLLQNESATSPHRSVRFSLLLYLTNEGQQNEGGDRVVNIL